jgi:hemerythrin-like domain-containing protein
MMLAAASAWRILETEHARLRQLLAAIAQVLDNLGWQDQRAQRHLLRRLIREFREFETQAHRPKGVVLLGSMRGRSAQADRLLDTLEHESEECDQLLVRSLALIDALGHDDRAEAEEVASILQRHRDLMMRHLDEEDTVLCWYTSQLLTPEEWSAVVSSISSVEQKARRRRL